MPPAPCDVVPLIIPSFIRRVAAFTFFKRDRTEIMFAEDAELREALGFNGWQMLQKIAAAASIEVIRGFLGCLKHEEVSFHATVACERSAVLVIVRRCNGLLFRRRLLSSLDSTPSCRLLPSAGRRGGLQGVRN
jgi:hypothetical protein